MGILPAELMFEILLLLPIAALVRFRCVSKIWRSLIDSPKFVNSHFDLSNKADSMLILLGKPNAYQIPFDSVCDSVSPHPLLKQITPNPCLGTDHDNLGVVDPCNGLICIKTNDGFFCVWNPCTGKHFHVPQLPLEHQNEFVMCSWGFGYDSDSNDYRVACIHQMNSSSGTTAVWVYSLKSGLWNSIGDFPYLFVGFGERGVFVNGALHWINCRHTLPFDSKLIVALDLGNLEYNLVAQPESMQNPMVQFQMQLYIGVLDECLYALYEDRNTNAYELWVMKQYGVNESWTQLFAFTFSVSTFLTPLAFNEAGDLLVWVSDISTEGISRGLMRYEFGPRSFNRVEETFRQDFGLLLSSVPRAFVYIPSLLCPQEAGQQFP